MTAWIAMALAGSLGALARYGAGMSLGTRGILLVNLTGTFALGVLAGAGVHGAALLIAGTGFLGAYTTFSTWIVDRRYIALSIAGGLALAWLGWLAGGVLG